MLCKGRARIEQAIGKLKRFKRIALRCKKTAESYGALAAFVCISILVKSVHTAEEDSRSRITIALDGLEASHMRLITSRHSTDWATRDKYDCQRMLPILVGRLVRATAARVGRIDFHGGDTVSDEGCQGRLSYTTIAA